ncbi:MAG: HEAT repeat domain-containing protein [Planctomycetota bacterium]
MRGFILFLISASFLGNVLSGQSEERIKELVKLYIEQLKSTEKDTRGIAAEKLSQIGPPAKMAIPPLSALYGEEKNPWVRKMVLTALWKVGGEYKSAQAIILKALKKDPSNEVKAVAISICGSIGQRMGEEVVPYLLSLTKEPEELIRKESLLALKKMGKLTQENVAETILDVMSSERDSVILAICAEILGNIGETGKGVAPSLIESLKKSNPRLQVAAARALGKIGTSGEDAVPTILQYLKSPEENIRLEMILALKDYGPNGSKKAGTYLKEAAKDKMNSWPTQKAAIEALGRMGPLADKSIEIYLNTLAKEKDKKKAEIAGVAQKALETLQYLKNQGAIDNVNRLLGTFAGSDKKEIDKAKEEIEKLGIVIFPRLAEALREAERQGKQYVCDSLRSNKWTEESKDLLLAIAETAIYGTPEAKVSALKVLGNSGALGKDLLPYIVDGLSSEVEEVQLAATNALGDLGGEFGKDGILSLTYALKDAKASVRMASITALEKMKASSAKQAVEQALAEESDENVKQKMQAVLGKL